MPPQTILSRYSTGVVIICSCLVALITFGPRSTFGLFFVPISSEYSWSRDVLASAVALQNLVWGLSQPAAGALGDRFGVSRVLIIGAVLYAAGLALITLSDSSILMHLSAGLLVGLGLGGASFLLVIAAVNKLTPPHIRPLAVGLATAASSFGQFLFSPLSQAFISSFGWQVSLLLIAATITLVIPLAFAFRQKTAPSQTKTAPAPPTPPLSQAVIDAFSHPSYLLLFFGFFVCGFHIAFITTHLPPYLIDLGASPQLSAWALGFIGLFNIFGAFISGVASSKFSKRIILSSIYLARGVVIAAFLVIPFSTASVLFFSAAMGILWLSTVPPTSTLVSVMFGPQWIGALFGLVFFSHQAGAYLGVLLGGVLYDAYNSYLPVWIIAVILSFIAAALHIPIRERPAPKYAAFAS